MISISLFGGVDMSESKSTSLISAFFSSDKLDDLNQNSSSHNSKKSYFEQEQKVSTCSIRTPIHCGF